MLCNKALCPIQMHFPFSVIKRTSKSIKSQQVAEFLFCCFQFSGAVPLTIVPSLYLGKQVLDCIWLAKGLQSKVKMDIKYLKL